MATLQSTAFSSPMTHCSVKPRTVPVGVNAKFVNGKPAGIEAKYVMRTPRDWDRFMRFMERYANANGLSFVKK